MLATSIKKKNSFGVPVLVRWKRIRLGTIGFRVRSLASLSGLGIWHCHELWCRPAATALTGLLAWKLPCAAVAALKEKKKERKKLKL